MTKLDPIIAVKDVKASSEWYQAVSGCRSMHGGSEFDILVLENEEILLCLHEWNAHEHPTMTDPSITPGNGLILYFRTDKMETIRQNVARVGGINADARIIVPPEYDSIMLSWVRVKDFIFVQNGTRVFDGSRTKKSSTSTAEKWKRTSTIIKNT